MGQYDLIAPLGKGGMGVVWKAVHRHLDQTVAVKFLSPESWTDPQAIARFYREMRAAGRVIHPNIVRALDAGEIEGHHLLVMECLEGMTVRDVMWEVRPMAIADACEIVRQTASGLAAIADAALVHRDLKPSNLFLTNEGTIKILDLGLAKIRSEEDSQLTGSRNLMGTIDYMSPEQSSDPRSVDVRADLYSLGCTLYALLAGQSPFGSDRYSSFESKLRAHREEAPPVLSAIRHEIPDELILIVDRLLAKSPADRVQSPQDLQSLLAPFTAGHQLRELLNESVRRRQTTQIPRRDELRSQTSHPVTAAGVETSNNPIPETVTPKELNRGRELKSWSRHPNNVIAAVVLVVGGFALILATTFPQWRGSPWESEAASPNSIVALSGQNLRSGPDSRDGRTTPTPNVAATQGTDSWKPLPLQWWDLLSNDPQVVFWDRSDGFANFKFDPAERQLKISNSRRGLLAFERIENDSFVLQFGIHQNNWTGGCGVFVALDDWDPADPESIWNCIEFDFRFREEFGARPGDRREKVPLFEVNVSRLKSSLNANRKRQIVPTTFASDAFGQPVGEAIFEMQVKRGRLDSLKFDGHPLRDLTVRVQRDQGERPWTGYVGAAVSGGDGTYLNSRIKILSDELGEPETK